MKLKSLPFFISTVFFAFLELAVQTHAQKNHDQVTLFDAPGASGGTFPRSINPRGSRGTTSRAARIMASYAVPTEPSLRSTRVLAEPCR
jgi:hypothetical protein